MADAIRDEHGTYEPDRGSSHPIDPDDVSYDPCNAVLKYTWERYGERRYCPGMAVSNFTKHGVETDYEHPEFCKHHQSRAKLMKQHEEQLKTGAHAKTHEHLFQHLPPHKQILANDLFKSLLAESTYDFETESIELEVDISETDFAPDADTLVLDHPVPESKKIRAKALWFASLDFITMESIREEQFRVASEETVEGRELAIGERKTFISTEDDFKEVADEHHLNLPLSRIQGDYENHLTFGGVSYDTDDTQSAMGTREWVAVVEPDESSPMPETTAGSDTSPLHDIEPPADGGE